MKVGTAVFSRAPSASHKTCANCLRVYGDYRARSAKFLLMAPLRCAHTRPRKGGFLSIHRGRISLGC